MYALVTEYGQYGAEVDQWVETQELAMRERKDLRNMGCTVTIVIVAPTRKDADMGGAQDVIEADIREHGRIRRREVVEAAFGVAIAIKR